MCLQGLRCERRERISLEWGLSSTQTESWPLHSAISSKTESASERRSSDRTSAQSKSAGWSVAFETCLSSWMRIYSGLTIISRLRLNWRLSLGFFVKQELGLLLHTFRQVLEEAERSENHDKLYPASSSIEFTSSCGSSSKQRKLYQRASPLALLSLN